MNPTSGVIQESWDMFTKHWQRFVSIALIVNVVVGVLIYLVAQIGSFTALILVVILSSLALYLVQGPLIKAVEDVRDGRADMTVGQTFSAAMPFLGSMLAAGLLAAIGIGIGFVLLIVPGLILMTIWVAIIPAIVLENRGPIDSFTRSRELVSGNGWNVFGIIVLVDVIQLVARQILIVVLSPLNAGLQYLIATLVTGTLIAPFVTIVWTLLYYRLTEAKGGAIGPTTPPPTV